jgi:hypothetical protein
MVESRTYEGNGHRVTIADLDNITQDECLALVKCGKDAWNSWRSEFPVREMVEDAGLLSGFPENVANFSGKEIGEAFSDLRAFDLGRHVDFRGAKFKEVANFTGMKLCSANFSGCLFERGAVFDDCTFTGSVRFDGAYLPYVSFFGVDFKCLTSFRATVFSGEALYFNQCDFSSGVDFSGQDWSLLMSRRDMQISAVQSRLTEMRKMHGNPTAVISAVFLSVTFSGDVNFSSRRFVSSLEFVHKVVFTKPPVFQSAVIAQGADFQGAIFPKAEGSTKASTAYRILKVAFSQQQAIREEQRFFKLEMEEEVAREKGLQRWLYRAYKYTSDFGFSVSRPLVWFTFTLFIMLLLYAWQSGLSWVSPQQSTHLPTLLQFGVASALPSFEKLAEPAAMQLFGEAGESGVNYSVWTVITLLVHKTLSLLFLFLAGLALRNLFKMK